VNSQDKLSQDARRYAEDPEAYFREVVWPQVQKATGLEEPSEADIKSFLAPIKETV